jgi:phosphoribosylaminoimidazole-succinocarboxamide synthase
LTPLATATAGDALPLPLEWRGKVRDVYRVDADRLLLVASDRISAFDVVMGEAIPWKGVVLTQLTVWWLRMLADRVFNHLITADVDEIVRQIPVLEARRDAIAGRVMLCRRARVFPVECVIRGYLAGSAWKEYQVAGTLAGEPLPRGLRESDRLEPAVFSPATKAVEGHDENITIGRMASIVGEANAAELERLTRLIYGIGAGIAQKRGIIIADTKFEFGLVSDRIALVDEVLTPDSSRFWPADQYQPGRSQRSFDKQPLRDYLDLLRRSGAWNGEAPAPRLSPEIVAETSARYLDSYRRITGGSLTLPERS